MIQFLSSDYDAVLFSEHHHQRIKIKPMYFELGFSPYKAIYGRALVLRLLKEAFEILPDTLGLLIWDVYRPRTVQGKLFDWMSRQIRIRYPHLSQKENHAETLKFMSAPSKIGDAYCAPHLSGGAIDLTLFDTNTGITLNMGTEFDDCSEKASRDYFMQKHNVSADEITVSKHRNLLRDTMEHLGFTSYQHEWWHFDIGDVFWAKELGCEPLFGALFGDLEWPQ